MDPVWTIVFGVVALLTRVGLAMYASGTSRSKNAAGAVLRNVCDLCVAVLAAWAVGGRLPTWLGARESLVGTWALTFFATTLIATGVFAGTVAERSRFFPICAASALLAGVVVPVGWWWVRDGWLARVGMVDHAGATFIHLAGGVCAAVGVVLVGPRGGKYNRDGSSNFIPGHNVPLAAVGVLVMLVGWVGYVTVMSPSGTLGSGAINVLLAGAAGGLASLLYGHFRYGKPDLLLTYVGLLGALVSITGGAGEVPGWGAIALGAVAGVLVPFFTVLIDTRWKLDDPSGGVAVHVVGGVIGALAVPWVVPGLAAGERLRLLGAQALGVAAIGALSLVVSFTVLFLVKRAVGLRSSEQAEFDGLDLAEHDVNAYPDFQQTMIKSYHLREA